MYENIIKRLNNDSDNYFMNDFPSFYSNSLKEFIKDLIIFDPIKRPSFQEIAKKDFLNYQKSFIDNLSE